MAARPKYRRVLLKLSGEAFGREAAHCLQLESLRVIAQQIADRQAIVAAFLKPGSRTLSCFKTKSRHEAV